MKLLSISDIHLGHRRIPATAMIDHLAELVFPRLSSVDVLAISGDVFDNAISLHDKESLPIIAFIIQLLTLCNEHHVSIKIVRGTWLHDRSQVALFETLHREYGFTNPLTYRTALSLEYDTRLKRRFLYIPDDLKYNTSDECLQDISLLLEEHQCSDVDYVLMHGYFDHVLPAAALSKQKCVFRADQFSFVTGYVLTGHEHRHSQHENILYNGSFERLTFGDECKKGFLLLDDHDDPQRRTRITFVENTRATKFDTHNVMKITDSQKLVDRVNTLLRSYPIDRPAYVQIVHSLPALRPTLSQIAAREAPHVLFSQSTKRTNEPSIYDDPIIPTVAILEPPSEERLPSLIHQRLNIDVQSRLSVDRIKALLADIE